MKIIENNQNLVKENFFEVLFYQSIKCILKMYKIILLSFFAFVILFLIFFIPLEKKIKKNVNIMKMEILNIMDI